MQEPQLRPDALAGRHVGILLEDGFEDAETLEPAAALRAAGAEVTFVGPEAGRSYTGKHGASVTADRAASAARPGEFDALVIPGGYAPDRMRLRHAMVDLARDMVAAGKPVGAICHGAQLLISADVLRGRTLTCWPSIAVDVKNAGGLYVDQPVARDRNLITSRKPADLPRFNDALVRAIAASGPAR